MSAPVTTRRVAVFTLFLSTAWLAATTGASALVPEPPASATRGHSHHVPGAGTSSAGDVTVWLLAAIGIVAVVAIAAGVAAVLRRNHLHSPTHAVS
jgi:hypothetical protein